MRDASGEPTGILKDNAMELVSRVIPEASREMNLRAARAALAEAARFGVTTIQDNSRGGRAARPTRSCGRGAS